MHAEACLQSSVHMLNGLKSEQKLFKWTYVCYIHDMLPHTQAHTMYSQQVTLYAVKRPARSQQCLSIHKEAFSHIKTLLQFSVIVMHIYYVYSGWLKQPCMTQSISFCADRVVCEMNVCKKNCHKCAKICAEL